MVSQTSENIAFTSMKAKMGEIIINEINNQDTVKGLSFLETFSLKQ